MKRLKEIESTVDSGGDNEEEDIRDLAAVNYWWPIAPLDLSLASWKGNEHKSKDIETAIFPLLFVDRCLVLSLHLQALS